MSLDLVSIYPYIFLVHVSCAVVSLLYFTLRGYWMLCEFPMLDHRFNKFAPHIIDTVLLGSAICLTLIIGQYPLQNNWLTVKVTALLLYIVLGNIALKRGTTKVQRAFAFALALCTFGFIISVAYYHHPLGLLH
jgi:uncharacterized membrane protein SirB2